MPALYAASDLVVCRAGATTLAEVTARSLPCVLVPYPFAADNHQEKNALSLVGAGAALMLKDGEVREKLGQTVTRLCADSSCLQGMGAASGRLGRPDALELILKEIRQLCGGLG